jgi:hypothetical protein
MHSGAKREWSALDLQALDDDAERTWGAAERARAETALRIDEAKYRVLFEAIDEGFTILDVVYKGFGHGITKPDPGVESPPMGTTVGFRLVNFHRTEMVSLR